MTVPVIESFARQHPDVRVSVCSRAWARPIFNLLPKNVSFIVARLNDEHRGLKGMNLLGRRLLALQPTHVADLHDVLRTKYLRARFFAAGMNVKKIHKDRRARKKFLTSETKTMQVSVFDKYADVFRRLGYEDLQVDFTGLFPEGTANLQERLPEFDFSAWTEPQWVAVAPFATHEAKVYPLEQMEAVVRHLSSRGDVRVLLFGDGLHEREQLEQWQSKYPHVESMVGRLGNLAGEAAVISHCRVMLSMDSANMHLASLVGVPVVSVWGATHSYGGFLGYGQRQEDAVQLMDLPCRPCSIYGNAPCQFGDCRCLRGILPETILARLEHYLKPVLAKAQKSDT